MLSVLRRIRRQGPVRLAREFAGSLLLHGWQPTQERVRAFVARSKGRAVEWTATQGYQRARVGQLDFCRRYAEEAPRARQRMLMRLLGAHEGIRGVVLHPTSAIPVARGRAESMLQVLAEAGFLCLILPVDSSVPAIEERSERLYVARLYPDALAYFKDKPAVVLLDHPLYAYVPLLLPRAFVIYDTFSARRLVSACGADAAADDSGLRERADVVIEPSGPRHADKIVVVPNGAEGGATAGEARRNDLRALTLGVTTGLSESTDFELLRAIAALPDVRLVVAGPVGASDPEIDQEVRAKAESLLSCASCDYVGETAPEAAAALLSRIDALVVPLRPHADAPAVPPLEVCDAIAAGKPILALPTPAVAALAGTIAIASSDAIVRRLVDRDIPPVDHDAYGRFARAHRWSDLLAPVVSAAGEWAGHNAPPVFDVPASRRVDILNFNFFDWDGEKVFNGGAERYVHDVALLCRRLGLEPRLMQNARRPFERVYGGVPVIGIPLAERFELDRMSKAYQSHVEGAGLVIASPVDLAARLRIAAPLVGINHGIHWDNAANALALYSFERHRSLFDALQAIDCCVCVDTNFINWVRCHDWHLAQNLEYVPNYVDLEVFKPHAKDFDAERLTVLYPRRLYRARGFQDTLHAAESLFRRGVPIHLRLCGGADAADAALARDFLMRHPGVATVDELDIREMHTAYETSHIVLIPTNYSEGTSLSCIEAMATRNGIVATNVGGLPNLVIDGYNGLLISPGGDDLAAAIARLVDDRRLLATLAGRALEVAQAFSKTKWESRWHATLHRLLPSQVSPPPA
jgi:glycosyltransferase involved in cell wall biosynthesis